MGKPVSAAFENAVKTAQERTADDSDGLYIMLHHAIQGQRCAGTSFLLLFRKHFLIYGCLKMKFTVFFVVFGANGSHLPYRTSGHWGLL